jgi:alkylation response protein AidB-like acyl-CoA dehydrogenase
VSVFAQVSLAAGCAGVSPLAAKIFTIFEGTSEIQRMLIGRTITGLDVR